MGYKVSYFTHNTPAGRRVAASEHRTRNIAIATQVCYRYRVTVHVPTSAIFFLSKQDATHTNYKDTFYAKLHTYVHRIPGALNSKPFDHEPDGYRLYTNFVCGSGYF